jgi:hypothetical protein
MHSSYFDTAFDRLINISLIVIGSVTVFYPVVTAFA